MLERKAAYGIALALLLVVAIPFGMVVPAEAQSTRIVVVNPTAVGDFIFYTGTTKAGHRFNATIWICDVVDLQAFQICLTVNDKLLDIKRVWIPWDYSYVFYGKETCHCVPVLFDNDRDGSNEKMLAGDVLFEPAVTIPGWGKAVIVEFEILYEPTPQAPKVWDSLAINNIDTYLLDSNYSKIPTSMANGYYEYNYLPPIHDVAITKVTPSRTVVAQGHIAPIMVTVENQGNYIDFLEAFNVTVYANTTVVETQTITDMPSMGAKQILSFNWNTSGFVEGNYTIWAYAEAVTDETDIADNTMTSPTSVKIFLGDLNNDGKVDVLDLAQIAKSFGTYLGDAGWNPMADLNKDGKVDIRDLVIVAKHFGQIEL